MLSVPPSVRIYVCASPTDMRKSFDGLAALARQVVNEDPLSGHLFVFCNRRTDRVKVLWWDRTGLALWYKRLEEGSFCFPVRGAERYEMESGELALVLQGVDLERTRGHPTFKLSRP